MLQHIRNVHKMAVVVKKLMKCDVCGTSLPTMEKYSEHHIAAHNFDAEYVHLVFRNDKEFHEWKAEEESSQNCWFILPTGPKKLATGETRIHYYCNRSGEARKKEGHSGRREKSQGSCRSGKICLSFITVTKDSTQSPTPEGTTIKVRYQRNHYGHKPEIQHLRMSEKEKASIAEDLERGVPMKTILKRIRTSVASELRPVHLAERLTLPNIKQQFNIAAPERCHTNDSVSVDTWVLAMKEKGETLVRLYKAQGAVDPSGTFSSADFALVLMTEPQKELLEELGPAGTVCLDSTHGTTGYQFELTTLLVLDKVGSGVPIAYFICNRMNEKTLTAFFKCLESAMAKKVAAKTFTWCMVMGAPKQKLLCAWHVDKNWRKKILECVEKQLRPDVYHSVRLLLEFLDEEEFEEYLKEFLSSKEEKLTDFLKYFKDHYAVRPQEWAYCFRTRAAVNTNMHLESMHRTLKHTMLEGKQNKRVDKLISALMDLTLHFLMKRAIQMMKGAKGKKLSTIQKNHRSGSEMAACARLNEDGTWTVPSQSIKGLSYKVSKVGDGACCPLSCKECAVCVHTYMCTCYDHLIRFTVCKHIHCVVIANPTRCDKDHESSPEEACEASQALYIVQSIAKLEAAKAVSSSALLRAKMDSVRQAISDGEVSEGVAEKANKLFEPVFMLVESD
ncbi:uncharacterized protein [Dermacentor andersoni]|uniref:uncharacterized protein n=1 Tax=Dermacentor andersoni TaxID=34620 RepID=UPI003B3B25D5